MYIYIYVYVYTCDKAGGEARSERRQDRLARAGRAFMSCTPGLHNKILHRKIFARVWVAQESNLLHYQR